MGSIIKYLNNFLFPNDLGKPETNNLSEKQSFYMACTHVLYNKACPTEMFYAFPVRVDNTCCFLTLGVENELPIDIMLVISHIIKSIYHHSLDRDYRSLNALERNRIAHGAVHKIRGPLNVLSEFPYQIIDTLKENLPILEYHKIEAPIKIANDTFLSSLDNINIGLKSLEKFIDIEEEGCFNLTNIVKNAIETYLKLNISILHEITLNENLIAPILIFGVDSQIQFIFEELISNSIRAFKHYKSLKDKKLIININIEQSDKYTIVHFIDNGIGIEPNKKNLIFSSGFRGKDSGGTGKGLFLSKLFLNKYNHEILECGEYGTGAHFKIEFLNHKVV